MKKKFKVLPRDCAFAIAYAVWQISGCIHAQFYGKHSRHYARAFCKMLNALPEKDKP